MQTYPTRYELLTYFISINIIERPFRRISRNWYWYKYTGDKWVKKSNISSKSWKGIGQPFIEYII